MIRPLASLAVLAGFANSAAAELQLTPLFGSAMCNHCEHFLLPGRAEPSPHTRWTIHSDLPEAFRSPGVLYTTRPALPPFLLDDGTPLLTERLTQLNRGFTTIDDSFEVFVFHITRPGDGTQPRRIVVYARNAGDQPVTITPRQAMVTDGVIMNVHEMESNLGIQVLSENWARPFESLTIAPGEGEVIAFSKIFGTLRNDDDHSANVNCFGIVRADVEPAGAANLEISVLGIPADTDRSTLTAQTKPFLNVGAQSAETFIDLNTDPTGCQLRRATGVFDSFIWRSDLVHIPVNFLPEEGVKFQMALPAIQSVDCPEARQTVDLVLHPPYTRPDTIGNYKIEYHTTFLLTNEHSEPAMVDVGFGKPDASIGLGWQIHVGNEVTDDGFLSALPVRTGWAGPRQPALTRTFLDVDGGPIHLGAGESRVVSLRYMVLGNSSLPFQLYVAPVSKD